MPPTWPSLAWLVLLALLAELLPIRLSDSGMQVTVTTPIICATIVVHGTLEGLLVDGIVTYIAGSIALRRRVDLKRWQWVSFNTAQAVVSAAGAGLVTSLIPYVRGGSFTPNMLVGSVVAVGSYMSLNSFIVAWCQQSINGRSVRYWLNSMWGLVGPQYLVHGLMALVIVVPYSISSAYSAVAIFLPIIAARNYFRLRAKLVASYRETIRALGLMIQLAHPYTGGHLDRVAVWGSRTARLLGLPAEDADLVYDAALLHDIGKIAVNEEILNKPAKLTEVEREIVNRHPELGAQIIGEIKYLEPLAEWILYHHERPDGRGYPHGLRDRDIPLQSKIISVVDAFDAMVGGGTPGESRPYRRSLSLEAALAELQRCAGSQFDRRVVDAFSRVVKETAR